MCFPLSLLHLFSVYLVVYENQLPETRTFTDSMTGADQILYSVREIKKAAPRQSLRPSSGIYVLPDWSDRQCVCVWLLSSLSVILLKAQTDFKDLSSYFTKIKRTLTKSGEIRSQVMMLHSGFTFWWSYNDTVSAEIQYYVTKIINS